MKHTLTDSGMATERDHHDVYDMIFDAGLMKINNWRWELNVSGGRASSARIVGNDGSCASWILANMYSRLTSLSKQRRRERVLEAARLMAEVAP